MKRKDEGGKMKMKVAPMKVSRSLGSLFFPNARFLGFFFRPIVHLSSLILPFILEARGGVEPRAFPPSS